MVDIKQIADEAEVIIDGYAFSKFEGGYRVLNLNAPDKAAVFAVDGSVLETTMNDIELHIASKYLSSSLSIWRRKMPKYYEFKVAGYYLYFTSFCVVECMHVHASDKKLTEAGSAKFFVKGNGDSVLQNKGILTDREISKIQAFIKENYEKMYEKWAQYSENGFYRG